jgi:WD40 repeat protein
VWTMHACGRVTEWTEQLCCVVQLKAHRRKRKLVTCLRGNRAVIHDLETGEQKIIEIERPLKCSSSSHYIAVTTYKYGVYLLTVDGVLVHIIPDSTYAKCVAFHPQNTSILAIGYEDGTVRLWDVSTQSYASLFKEHTDRITSIRFASNGGLFLSSYDFTASIFSLDDQFEVMSSIRLEGHSDWVNDIIWLPSSNQVVTCSVDETIKVWDCQTGSCLRTLTEHTGRVTTLAILPSGQNFASGSYDKSVIIWSSETSEILRRISFLNEVELLVSDESDTLYVGVYNRGVLSCNALAGEVGSEIIAGRGFILGLALGMNFKLVLRYLFHNLFFTTVPAPKPWTSSTHALWPLPAQHIVHMAVVVLWKVRDQGRLMQVPYELVEMIAKFVR